MTRTTQNRRPLSPAWVAPVLLDAILFAVFPLAGLAALGLLLILAGLTR